MSHVEQPVHCLAVRVYRLNTGEIDTDELVELLDAMAGPHQWLMTARWLFRAPPIETRPGLLAVPAICPQGAAERLKASQDGRHRILTGEVISGTELRQWRWVAFQVHPNSCGHGAFPWETDTRGGVRLHGQ